MSTGRDRSRYRRRLLLASSVCALAVATAVAPRVGFAVYARPRVLTIGDVPPRDVAIVLGARVFPGGRPSAMLLDRVRTGADLYRAGKARVLLMSGDNSTVDYNEPGTMQRMAESLGVPSDVVVADYAGRRTYDTCYRARHIFQVKRAILVTQGFHLDRALALCNALGIDSVGVAADYQRPEGYDPDSIRYSTLREVPAALAALAELIRRPEPILGEPLPIELPSSG